MATALAKRGHDVRALTDEPALEGLDDEDVLRLAVEQDRILVTYDVKDFPPPAARLGRGRAGTCGMRRRPRPGPPGVRAAPSWPGLPLHRPTRARGGAQSRRLSLARRNWVTFRRCTAHVKGSQHTDTPKPVVDAMVRLVADGLLRQRLGRHYELAARRHRRRSRHGRRHARPGAGAPRVAGDATWARYPARTSQSTGAPVSAAGAGPRTAGRRRPTSSGRPGCCPSRTKSDGLPGSLRRRRMPPPCSTSRRTDRCRRSRRGECHPLPVWRHTDDQRPARRSAVTPRRRTLRSTTRSFQGGPDFDGPAPSP